MGPTADAPVLRYYDIGPGVTAFSTTRYGGYSSGPYGGMNVNRWCGDDPETVARNMTALGNTLWPDKYKDGKIVIPHQTHGTKVVHVDSKLMAMSITERDKALESTDALMTDIEDVCIGVSTADCIPVLLYDNEHRAVCAVHAGWRCTVERITEKAVGAMTETFDTNPSRLKAVIGPGISLEAFEVGDEVYEAFTDAGFCMETISRHKDKWHIDLWECNRHQLINTGIPQTNITIDGTCTYANHEMFFSARRLGTASGRIFTGIIVRSAHQERH